MKTSLSFLSLAIQSFVYPCYSMFHNFLLKSNNAPKLRSFLQIQMEENYKYIPYTRAKSILHEKINHIDLYGDNEEAQNVEHVFPQYSFKFDDRKKIMKSDLHNLYLCNVKLNTCRQNFKYVTHHDAISQTCNDKNTYILDQKGDKMTNYQEVFKKQGYIMSVNRKQKSFIPSTYSRGKIARSLTYFAVKYNYMKELQEVIDIYDLLIWNFSDPVDNEEYLKNVLTSKYQNNMNPFILYPELVPFVFSDIIEFDKYYAAIGRSKKFHHYVDHMETIGHLLQENTILENSVNKLEKIVKKNGWK